MMRLDTHIIFPNARSLILALSLGLLIPSPWVFAQGRPPAKVEVSPVVMDSVLDQVLLIGTVDSWRSSQVAAEVSGQVISLRVRRGALVEKGAVLAELGASDLLLQIKAAEAARKAALARLEKARDNLKRSENLIKEKLISEKDYRDSALTVTELEEALGVSRAEHMQLNDLLAKKQVRAPFTGIVTQELVEVGEWLEKGGGVVQMVDAAKVRIWVDMPEKYVPHLKMGGTAVVRFDGLGDESFSGAVHALIPQGDRDARLFPLEVHVDNADFRIKAGMLARVHFDLGLERRVLMVDKDAVIRRGADIFLFAVEGDKAAQRKVSLGSAKGGRIEVAGPIEEGTPVVIRGNERLRDGQAVQVVP